MKMIVKSKFLFIGNFFSGCILVLAVLLATSCNNIIELQQKNGSLAITLPSVRGASDSSSFEVDVTGTTGEFSQSKTALGGQTIIFGELVPDTYLISVAGLDATDAVVSYGFSSASVEAGKSASAVIDLMEIVTTFENLQKKISEGGSIYIGNDIEITAPLEIKADVTVSIQAAHQDVVLSSSGTNVLFNVTGGALSLGGGKYQLTLDGKNKGEKGLSITSGETVLNKNAIITNYTNANIEVNGGTFNLEGGIISGATENTSGIGVRINSAIFNLTDGAIEGIQALGKDGSAVYLNGGSFNMTGGSINGVAAQNGVVYVNNGTFTMSGGSIKDNKVTQGSIYVNKTFTMSGGSISGNTATTNGGGVYLNSGTLNVSGGTISGNTATADGGGVYLNSGTLDVSGGSTIEGNRATNGGGVYLNNGTLNMSGGTISGNTATTNGGGVCVNSGTLNMSGGTVSGNEASQGHGVYHNGGIFKMSGSTMVNTDNEVYLNGTSITFGSFVGSHVIARITLNNYEDYTGSKQVLIKESDAQTLTEDVTSRFTITKTEDGGTYTILTTSHLEFVPEGQ